MDCPHVPELSYGEFSERLHGKVAGQRVPIVGSIELTFRCNLGCVHCYLGNLHCGIPGQQELTGRELCGILDQIAEAGCLWLALTGGEVLLRPDFLDVYMHAKRRGFLTTILTNGTLLDPYIADTLAEWRPFSVDITLYGRTQETYERITGVPGSYGRCLHGVELLLQRGVPVRLKTMVMTLNVHELWDIKAYAESLGVPFYYDPMIHPGVEGSSDPLAYRLSPEEIVQLDVGDPERLAMWQKMRDDSPKTLVDPHTLYNCGAGLNGFHIDPYGRLCLCMSCRGQMYDLRQGTFREGWHSFLHRVRSQKPEGDYRCSQCGLIALCGQCPGWALMENGDPQEPVGYLCRLGHLRDAALRLAAQAHVRTAEIPN